METEADRLAAAEGLELVGAPETSSGYKGVKHHKDHRHKARPYEARSWVRPLMMPPMIPLMNEHA